MKKLFLLLFISQTSCPMLSIIQALLGSFDESFQEDYEKPIRFPIDHAIAVNPSENSRNMAKLEVHFQKIKVDSSAKTLTKKNNLVMMSYYFKKWQQLQALNQLTHKVKVLHQKRKDLLQKNKVDLQTMVKKRPAKKIKQSENDGFVYVLTPNHSYQAFDKISDKK